MKLSLLCQELPLRGCLTVKLGGKEARLGPIFELKVDFGSIGLFRHEICQYLIYFGLGLADQGF